jgi:hypothetical protein
MWIFVQNMLCESVAFLQPALVEQALQSDWGGGTIRRTPCYNFRAAIAHYLGISRYMCQIVIRSWPERPRHFSALQIKRCGYHNNEIRMRSPARFGACFATATSCRGGGRAQCTLTIRSFVA